jgi:hypothetical protein
MFIKSNIEAMLKSSKLNNAVKILLRKIFYMKKNKQLEYLVSHIMYSIIK